MQETRPGILQGYLSPGELPDSRALVPPPPAEGSSGHALDEEIAQRNVALRGTPRWTLATGDADLSFPMAAGTFSCALGLAVTEEDTPHLYRLLRRSLTDAGLATYRAKNAYARPRPFMSNRQPICTPERQAGLESNGSYPSGHTSIGWAWALILAELVPERADAILARGRAFGESRGVCNVHWSSDVAEGRVVGAATVARQHSDVEFLADLAAAHSELAAVRPEGLQPARDCDAETAALAP